MLGLWGSLDSAESLETQSVHHSNLSQLFRKCLAEQLVGYCFSQMEYALICASLLREEEEEEEEEEEGGC